MNSFKRIFFLILFAFSSCLAEKYELSIVAMFQNEAPYLKEWIEFHRLVGVEHFWLYNNNSTDDYFSVLEPYIRSGVVDLIEWPSVPEANDWKHHTFDVQTSAYNDAIKKARTTTHWLAIIDLDEFLFSPVNTNLTALLNKQYKKCSGICVNWQNFGTGNVESIGPGELMIEKLTMKADTYYARNHIYKSIVNPKYVKKCSNPHFCSYLPGHVNVNANREIIGMENNGIFVDKLRINHYWSRDESYFQNIKLPRYKKWNVSADEAIKEASKLNTTYDDEILKFVPELRKRMFAEETVKKECKQ